MMIRDAMGSCAKCDLVSVGCGQFFAISSTTTEWSGLSSSALCHFESSPLGDVFFPLPSATFSARKKTEKQSRMEKVFPASEKLWEAEKFFLFNLSQFSLDFRCCNFVSLLYLPRSALAGGSGRKLFFSLKLTSTSPGSGSIMTQALPPVKTA